MNTSALIKTTTCMLIFIGTFGAGTAHADEAPAKTMKTERPSFWDRVLPPEDQSKVRDEKSFTVGVPLTAPYNLPAHYQWRPNGRYTLGVMHQSGVEGSGYEFNDDHSDMKLTAEYGSTSLYVQYHPVAKSGFYLGLGGHYVEGNFAVNRTWDPKNYVAVDETVLAGSFSAIYAGPAVGFSWMWNNGITVGFDITMRKRFGYKVNYTERGDISDADITEARQSFAPPRAMGTWMFGYSF